MNTNMFKDYEFKCMTSKCLPKNNGENYGSFFTLVSMVVSILFWPFVVKNIIAFLKDQLIKDHHSYCYVCKQHSLVYTYKPFTIGTLISDLVFILESLILGLVVVGSIYFYHWPIFLLIVFWIFLTFTTTQTYRSFFNKKTIHENCQNCINPQRSESFCLHHCSNFSQLQLPIGIKKIDGDVGLSEKDRKLNTLKTEKKFILNKIITFYEQTNMFLLYIFVMIAFYLTNQVGYALNNQQVFDLLFILMISGLGLYIGWVYLLKSDKYFAKNFSLDFKHKFGIHYDLNFSYESQIKQHNQYFEKNCFLCKRKMMFDDKTGERLL